MSRSRYLPAPRRGGLLPAVSLDAQGTLELIVNSWREAKLSMEEQRTRRQEIAARENVALAEIRALQELLMTALERTFDERHRNFGELFARADRALEQGDPATLAAVMSAVTTLAASSPFRDLESLEATRAALQRRKSWEI